MSSVVWYTLFPQLRYRCKCIPPVPKIQYFNELKTVWLITVTQFVFMTSLWWYFILRYKYGHTGRCIRSHTSGLQQQNSFEADSRSAFYTQLIWPCLNQIPYFTGAFYSVHSSCRLFTLEPCWAQGIMGNCGILNTTHTHTHTVQWAGKGTPWGSPALSCSSEINDCRLFLWEVRQAGGHIKQRERERGKNELKQNPE